MDREIVCWPESQMLMEKKGFYENCTLINSERGIEKYGSSAYLVEKDWYDDFINNRLEDEDEDTENKELMVDWDFNDDVLED